MMLYNSDWLFITVLPFLYLCNGERGYTSRGAEGWLPSAINGC